MPVVLCPHGHWGNRNSPNTNGRFYEASDKSVQSQLKNGAEKTEEGAKYPLQARCAQLARMGCVVFHYDMIGYGDSQQIYHPLSSKNKTGGFSDAEAELRQQNSMGLQTWNSIRSLDFLLSLPIVDSDRIAVTGASGGGTQTFILSAIDDRVDVAWPAVMVSTAMQGGCVCENCTYLRVNTGNIELAALFAPKPLGMSAAKDWTQEIETKGLPELKALYKLYGKENLVMAKAYLQFGHNYNQMSRELMYNWFNKHLDLGQKTPVVEQPFVPIPPKDLSVFDEKHPRPEPIDIRALRESMTRNANRQLQELFPENAKKLKKLRDIIGPALAVMVNDTLPKSTLVEDLKKSGVTNTGPDGAVFSEVVLTRKGQGEAIPGKWMEGKKFNGQVVVWIHPEGIVGLEEKGKLIPEVQKILDQGMAVLAVDVLLTGKTADASLGPVNQTYPGYTWGYNRTLLANRVHDILTAVAFARSQPDVKTVHLVGHGKAGPWVVLARALCSDAVDKTAVDMNRFRFEEIFSLNDEMMFPGALKYGGMPAFTALCAPHELFLHNTENIDQQGWIRAAYQSTGQPDNLRMETEKVSAAEVINWLMQ